MLQAAGVKTEAHLPFAGVHQLLRPVRARVANLASAHHAALAAAFGVGESESPEPFRIAMAVLDLLSDVAADAPLLVTVDDGHRLDRASADVMAFVARRIESDPIVVLIATREGYPVSFTGAGLPEHRIGALDPASATELLEASGSHLSAVARRRLLREAVGNPLALVELPRAVGADPEQLSSGSLPLTDRLVRAVAARVADLPETTRWLLLVAAMNQEHVSEILRAGSLAAGRELDAKDLQPAADAAIVMGGALSAELPSSPREGRACRDYRSRRSLSAPSTACISAASSLPADAPSRCGSTTVDCSTSTRVCVPSSSIAGRNVAGRALVDVGATSTVLSPRRSSA